MSTHHQLRTIYLGSLYLACTNFCFAQVGEDNVTSEGNESLKKIEVIEVSTQNRVQTTQEVPIAITAFSGNALEERNIKSVNQFVGFTPGLSGQSQGFQGLETFSVRGISTSNFGTGGDLSVGVYLNGVYQPRNGANIGFFDMQRVEILKGPQGLLFGRNATSGAISLITHKPTDLLEGEVILGVEERNGGRFTGVLNVPLGEDFAVRIAAHHEETEGHVENVTLGNTAYGRNNDSIRLSSAYYGIDDWDINLIFDYEDRESSSGEIFRWSTLLDELTPIASFPQLSPPNDLRKSINDFNGGEDWESWGGSLSLQTSITSDIDFSSLTGLRAHNYNYSEDFDGMPIHSTHFFQEQQGEYYSQEFKFTGYTDNLTWFAGISMYKENISSAFALSGIEDDICVSFIGFNCEEVAGYTGDPTTDLILFAALAEPGTDLLDYSTIEGNNTGWAVFGESTISFAEDWELSIGARYTFDKKKYTRNVFPATSPLAVYAGLNGGYSTTEALTNNDSWSDFSPRVALSYAFSPEINIFASISKGYKSGGFDSFGLSGVSDLPTVLGGPEVDSPEALNSFDEETITSFEAGFKSFWWEDKIQLNASTYFYKYEDLQLIRRAGNAYIVNNVGEVDGQGIEIDFRLVPMELVDLTVGVSYLDTESDLTPEEEAAVCGAPCSGGNLPYSPEWTINSILTFYFPVFENHELTTSVEYSYQDRVYGELYNITPIEDFNILNLRIAVKGDDWDLNLYVQNLTNEETFNYLSSSHSSGISVPKTAGIELGYRF